jgi:hypothetical protein
MESLKMTVEKKSKAKAIRSFLKSSKASGMKFTTQPDALSDLANHIGISACEFDKLFKGVSVETIMLANAETRKKLRNYLDEMESTLRIFSEELSFMADEFRDDKFVLATVESNATTPVTNDELLRS